MNFPKKWGPFFLLFFIGVANYPGFYNFPFRANALFIGAQLFALFLIYLVSKQEREVALFLLIFNLYSLFLSSKVVYFSRPFIFESELLLKGKPSFYFYWYFLLSLLVLSAVLWASLRLKRRQKGAALAALILILGFYNMKFLKGNLRFSLTGNRVLFQGRPVLRLRHAEEKILVYYGRVRKNPRRIHVLIPRRALFSLRKFKIARVGNLYIQKDFFILRAGGKDFPVLFPWHLLEILLLPFSFFLLWLAGKMKTLKLSFVFLLVIIGSLFFLQGSYFYRASPKNFLYFDTWEYIIRAESLLRGFSYGEEILIGGNGPCHWPPGTILYNAAFIWFFSRNWSIYIFLRTLLFILSLLLLKRIAETYELSPWGLVLLTGLSGYTIYFVSTESEGVFLPVFLLNFYFLRKKGKFSTFLTGIFLGLASLIRPFALTFSALWAILKRRAEALLLLTAFVLTILPWSIRCSQKSGKPVPISNAGSHTFLEGNSPFSNGGWAVPASIIRKWKKAGHNPASIKEVILYNLHHPQNIIRLLPLKLYWAFWKEPKNRQWHPPGVPGERNYGVSLLRFKFYTPFSEGVKMLLYLLALLGILSSALRNWGKFKFPLITLGGFLLITLLFFGLPRYTSPFSPFVYLFSLKGWKDVS